MHCWLENICWIFFFSLVFGPRESRFHLSLRLLISKGKQRHVSRAPHYMNAFTLMAFLHSSPLADEFAASIGFRRWTSWGNAPLDEKQSAATSIGLSRDNKSWFCKSPSVIILQIFVKRCMHVTSLGRGYIGAVIWDKWRKLFYSFGVFLATATTMKNIFTALILQLAIIFRELTNEHWWYWRACYNVCLLVFFW